MLASQIVHVYVISATFWEIFIPLICALVGAAIGGVVALMVCSRFSK